MYELWVFRFGCKGTRNYLCTLSCLRHPIERVDHDEFFSEAVIKLSFHRYVHPYSISYLGRQSKRFTGHVSCCRNLNDADSSKHTPFKHSTTSLPVAGILRERRDSVVYPMHHIYNNPPVASIVLGPEISTGVSQSTERAPRESITSYCTRQTLCSKGLLLLRRLVTLALGRGLGTRRRSFALENSFSQSIIVRWTT